MIHAECSTGELRELIAAPPHIERVLRIREGARRRCSLDRDLSKVRKAEAEEFERLLCAAAEGIYLPEVDDGVPDPVEQGRAAA
jgi:hypothetical protein